MYGAAASGVGLNIAGFFQGNTVTLALSIATKTSAIRWSRRRRGTSDFNTFVSVLPEI